MDQTERQRAQLVDGRTLLSQLFEAKSRPSLRWLASREREAIVPSFRIGRRVFYSAPEVYRTLLARTMPTRGRFEGRKRFLEVDAFDSKRHQVSVGEVPDVDCMPGEASVHEQLVSGRRLLEILFSQPRRPCLRWLRSQQRCRRLPYIRLGRLVFFVPSVIRANLLGGILRPRGQRRYS